MAEFDIGKRTIDEVFVTPDLRFEIPRYQRQYAWEEENIEEFWNTVLGDEEIFLGTVILNNTRQASDKIVEIIDGQQRYLTIQILAAVLRDYCKEKGDAFNGRYAELAEGITTRLLARAKPLRPKELEYKLIPGESIRLFFFNYIQEPQPEARMNKDVPTGKDPEKDRVKKAYLKFRKLFGDHIKNRDEQKVTDFIEDLVLNKIGRHFFARIEIDNDLLAYEIFETVNAKRVDLNVADLIKNKIFRNVVGPDGGFEDAAKAKWSLIEGTLKDIGFTMKDFLSYYWSSRYGYVGPRLYREIQKKFSSKTQWKEFLDDLVENVELLGIIMDGALQDIEVVIPDRRDAKAVFDSLRVLRNTRAKTWSILYLTLFRLMKKGPHEEPKLPFSLRKKWDVFAKYTFVYFHILGLGGNWFFKETWTFSKDLEELVRKGSTKDKLESHFNKFMVTLAGQLPTSKEDFVTGFLKLRYKATDPAAKTIIRYVLTEIEAAMGHKFDVGFDEEAVNIEHVLPQQPKEWGLVKGDVKEFVDRIGNLLLISIPQNGSIGNKSLEFKLNHFDEFGGLRHVQEFVEKVKNGDWPFTKMTDEVKDFSAINIRGTDLADKAYKIWVVNLRKSMGVTVEEAAAAVQE